MTLFMGFILSPKVFAQYYWDLNAKKAGAGSNPDGTWNTTTANWDTLATGKSTSETFISGSSAVFSAGNDATGGYTVTVAGIQYTSGITVEEGTPTFSSGAISFTGASPDFNITTGLTTTVHSDITGTGDLNVLGGGTLIMGSSDKSYSGTTTLSAGVLQLDFNQSFGILNLAGGLLRLNSASSSIGQLNVTADSTIDFSIASTLNLTLLNVSAGVTLTVQNWTDAVDYFYAAGWSGATLNTRGSAPMNQVVFSGFDAANTQWQSYDHQVTPVPEPAAYGGLMLGSLTLLLAWRRRAAG